MKRREDWPERLSLAIDKQSQTPFAWGSRDCLLTVADLVESMTGEDPGWSFRGQYNSEAGALRLVKEHGCDSIEALLALTAAANHFPEINPKLAGRGDIVLFDAQEGTAFGIVGLNGRDAICQGPEGLRRLPVLTARRAWRVS